MEQLFAYERSVRNRVLDSNADERVLPCHSRIDTFSLVPTHQPWPVLFLRILKVSRIPCASLLLMRNSHDGVGVLSHKHSLFTDPARASAERCRRVGKPTSMHLNEDALSNAMVDRSLQKGATEANRILDNECEACRE